MSFLEFLPISGVVLSIFAFIVSVRHSQSLLNAHTKNLQNLLITKDKLVDDLIKPNDIDKALKLLTSFALKRQPNSIIGINRGGAMIGSILALQLKIPSKNYIQCYISKEKFDMENLTVTTEGQQLTLVVQGALDCYLGELGEG